MSNPVHLPRLPLPSLQETCDRFLTYVSPMLTPTELSETRASVEQFVNNEGPEIHEAVVQYDQGTAAASGSYIEKWWDDAYLAPRDPIAINVNPFFMLQDDPAGTKNDQSARAASLATAILKFHLNIPTLKPDEERGKPLCMYQYGKLMGATRLPRLSRDHLQSFPESRHIVVMYHNHFFMVNVLSETHEPISELDLQLCLKDILQRGKLSGIGAPVGVLTSDNRTQWAITRSLMENNGTNRGTFAAIDSALFLICLEDTTTDDPDQLSAIMLHGDARNRWFDKSVQLIVTAHGHAGLNMEHAGFDGHTLLRLATEVYMDSIRGVSQLDVKSFLPRPVVVKLEWDLTDTVLKSMSKAQKAIDQLIKETESKVLVFTDFGRKALIQHKVSPDAAVQMAFQLAYFRMHNSFGNTYESAMTKAYQHGRTEAMRSVTHESCAFSRALANYTIGKSTPTQEMRILLSTACVAHVKRLEECKGGRGVDRHLMALRKTGAELEYSPAIFRTKAYTEVLTQSVISTSNCGSTALSLFGFGPVVSNGYGIGYIIKDNTMHFNVTSKYRGTGEMVTYIAQALRDIKDLLEKTTPVAAPRSKL